MCASRDVFGFTKPAETKSSPFAVLSIFREANIQNPSNIGDVLYARCSRSDSAIPNSLLLGQLFGDMVKVVDCQAGVLGSNPCGPKRFPLGITSLVAAVIR